MSDAAKYAGGVWEAVDNHIVADGNVIASVYTSDDFPCMEDVQAMDHLDEVEVPATTRLMAASKDLLEALRKIAGHTDPYSEEENYRADDREGCLDTVYSIAIRAIAKATED